MRGTRFELQCLITLLIYQKSVGQSGTYARCNGVPNYCFNVNYKPASAYSIQTIPTASECVALCAADSACATVAYIDMVCNVQLSYKFINTKLKKLR